jgi:hypothetical protein
MSPGAMQFTRTLGPHSTAFVYVTLMTPAFAAP